MDKTISTLLKEIKAETGWSEHRIAKAIGTSQPTVNRILNGQDECKVTTLRLIEELHERACTAAITYINKTPSRRKQSARAKAN